MCIKSGAASGVSSGAVQIESGAAAGSSGRVTVEISTNRVDYSNNGILYDFKMQSVVNFIEPRLGPKTGGTLITINGAGFIQGTNYYCRFGESNGDVVPGKWIAASIVQCKSPPVGTSGTKPVYISTNLVDFTKNTVDAFFTFTNKLILNSLVPTSGPVFGGTNVTIFGKNFYPLPIGAIFRCRFDQKVVAAYVATPNSLVCNSPSFILNEKVN